MQEQDGERVVSNFIPDWPLEDKIGSLLRWVLFSDLDQLHKTYFMVSLVSRGFAEALATQITRQDWLKMIEDYAPSLKVDLGEINLSADTSDNEVRDFGKAIVAVYGITKRIAELDKKFHITVVKGDCVQIEACGLHQPDLLHHCNELFSTLEEIAIKFESSDEVRLMVARVAANLALKYLTFLTTIASPERKLDISCIGLRIYLLRVEAYLRFSLNHCNQLIAKSKVKAHGLRFALHSKFNYLLRRARYPGSLCALVDKLSSDPRSSMSCLVLCFAATAVPMPDPRQPNGGAQGVGWLMGVMNQNQGGLPLIQGLNRVEQSHFNAFWMITLDEDYARAKKLYQVLSVNNRHLKLISGIGCLPKETLATSLQLLANSGRHYCDDPVTLRDLMDRYPPRIIALLMLLDGRQPGILKNIASKAELIQQCLPRIVLVDEQKITTEEVTRLSRDPLRACLAAEDPTQREVVDAAANTNALSVPYNKYKAFLQERFPNNQQEFPYNLMAVKGFSTFCASVYKAARCSFWEYLGVKPLQALLCKEIASPEIFNHPAIFQKIDRMSSAQLLVALAFLRGCFQSSNVEYLKKSVSHAHEFLDWIIEGDATQHLTQIMPLTKILALPLNWRRILQTLCKYNKKEKDENLPKTLASFNIKVDETSAELVLQLLPFLADRSDTAQNRAWDKWLYFVVELTQLHAKSKDALATLVILKRKTQHKHFLRFISNYYNANDLKIMLSVYCADPLADPAEPKQLRLIEALLPIRQLRGIYDFEKLKVEQQTNKGEYLKSIFDLPAIRALIQYLQSHVVPDELLYQFSVEDICYLYDTPVSDEQTLFTGIFSERSKAELQACAKLFKNLRDPTEGDENDVDVEEQDIEDLCDTPDTTLIIKAILTYYPHSLIKLNSLYMLEDLLINFTYFHNKERAREVMHIAQLSAFLINAEKPAELFNQLEKRELWPVLIKHCHGPGFSRLCSIMIINNNPLLTPDFLAFAANKETQVNLTLLEWLLTTQTETIDCLFSLLDVAHYQQSQVSFQQIGEAFITDLQTKQILYSILHITVTNPNDAQKEKRQSLLQEIIDANKPNSKAEQAQALVKQLRERAIEGLCSFTNRFRDPATTAAFFDQGNTKLAVKGLKSELTSIMEKLQQYEEHLPDDPGMDNSNNNQPVDPHSAIIMRK